MVTLKEILPGIATVLMITTVSLALSLVHSSFDALVISIIFGMLVANILKEKDFFSKGASFALKIFLPVGIALYGAQLKFVRTDLSLWFYTIATFIMLFGITYIIAKGLGLTKSLGILLSVGISVCGASAIAIISFLIRAKKEEISVSIISVMVLGLAGMIFYPLMSDILVLNKTEFAFLSGTTLPMLGQVKATAATAGTDVLALALKLKLLRISCLTFLPVLAMILAGRANKFYVPWFIVVFVFLVIVVNVADKTGIIARVSEPISKFCLSSALAAIGLSVDLESIADTGPKPLLTIFLSCSIVILILYLAFSAGNV